jgi:hypothetical protein
MPYTIVKEDGGARVHGPSGFKSKKPLTLRMAYIQRGIIEKKMKEKGKE